MKKVKFALLLAVLAALAVVYFANQEYFLAKQSLEISMNYHFYTTPEIPNGLFFLGCFMIGLFIALAYAGAIKYRAYKAIKLLNGTINEQSVTIGELQTRVEVLEQASGIKSAPRAESAETVVEAEIVDAADTSSEEPAK